MNLLDFTFTKEQELVRRAIANWCKKNLPLEKIREIDTEQEIPEDILQGMSDLGLSTLSIPAAHGGAGMDWITTCLAAEELGYADISVAIPAFFVIESAWGFIIDKYGSDQTRENVQSI